MIIVEKTTFTFTKDAEPVARVQPNEILLFRTVDCFGGQVKCENDLAESIDWENVNPATGPVYVEGAEKGDVLAVDILDIQVHPSGAVCTIPDCGPFSEKSGLRTHIIQIRDGYAHFKDTKWPIRPMVGVIGCAHDERDIPTGYVSDHGGNMDSAIITKGVTVWLPVRVKGALLAMGDLHATMADGEVIGNGIEIGGEVVVRVRLLKDFRLSWPITETEDAFYVNTCGPTCDHAIEKGYLEMHRLISDAYGWDYTDTAMYMTMQGSLSANQACLTDGAGGNTFRVGTPKMKDKKRLIG